MIYDLQKASILKRISAWLLDFILIVILAVGVMYLMALITGIEKHSDALQKYYVEFGEKHNVDLLISQEELNIPIIIVEFIIPLCLKNGRTVGKKVFNLGVVFKNSVKMSTFALFVRSILGKYTIETMVPILLLYMVFYNNILGITGLIVLGLLVVLQLAVVIATKTNSCIHDVLSNTAVVDMQTQMVFTTYDELMEYKESLHQEEVKKSTY